METLHADDWTLDPAIFNYHLSFRSNEYVKGYLAESWEFPDPNTYLVKLRKGVHWQDIPPVNGREFTADDVAYHYNRLYGLGGGFTKPSPYQEQ
jgi:ABC-type transport system substrate-binding protein